MLSRKGRRPDAHERARIIDVIRGLERLAGLEPRRWVIVVEKASSLNAYTSGRHTIGVTTASLRLSDSMFEAVMAHELGHQVNRDTWATSIRSWVVSPLRWISRIAQVGGWFFAAASLVTGAALLPALVLALAVWAASIPVLLLMPLTAWVQRRNELGADAVAARLGYREELAALILVSPDNELTGWKRLTSSHPNAESRMQSMYR